MKVKSVTIQEWQEFVESLPAHSFFQLPIFAQLFEKTYPECEIATKLFVFDDGVEVLLPLVKIVHKFGFESLESLPLGGYSGFLWNKRPSEAQIKQILGHLLTKRVLALEIFPKPWDSENGQLLESSRLEKKPSFTHILKLDKPEVLWKNLTHECRKNIQRAQKENLKLVEGQIDDLSSSYYPMYTELLGRWSVLRSRIIPLEFFQNLMRIKGEKVRLFYVEKEAQKIAGVIVVYGTRESVQWHTVSSYQYQNLRPNNFWEWELIKHAYEQGCEIHNFGSSVGEPGVQRFKESFGAEKLDYYYFVYESPLLKFYNKIKRLPVFGKMRV